MCCTPNIFAKNSNIWINCILEFPLIAHFPSYCTVCVISAVSLGKKNLYMFTYT